MHARAGGDAQLVPLLEEALSGLDDEDELRPRLLARLAGAFRDEPSRDRRAALSAEAVALARRAGNPSALAYALDGRHAAILGPDTAAECLALGTELLDVALAMGDLKMTVHGHLDRFIAEVTTGDDAPGNARPRRDDAPRRNLQPVPPTDGIPETADGHNACYGPKR
jgi:hypothetical protein